MLLNAMHSSCSKVQHSTGITTVFFYNNYYYYHKKCIYYLYIILFIIIIHNFSLSVSFSFLS